MKNKRYSNLADFGMKLLSSTVLEEGLALISNYSRDILEADRCSIFIYDKSKDELWTTIADGTEKFIITSRKGIVGKALSSAQTVVVNDTSSSKYFLSDMDKESGYETINVIASPIFSSTSDVIGILELLNKDGGFTHEDEKFMRFFSHFVSGFIELAPTLTSETITISK